MMMRLLVGMASGVAAGLTLIAGYGFYFGFQNGNGLGGTAAVPAGWGAAFGGAFVALAYFWWLSFITGLIGGAAALGSWFVRPTKARATTD
jgi:hypothetical protein